VKPLQRDEEAETSKASAFLSDEAAEEKKAAIQPRMAWKKFLCGARRSNAASSV